MALSTDSGPCWDQDSEDFYQDLLAKKALLARLTVPELRVLLVHFKLAVDKRDARSWPKSDMIEALAETMVEAA